MAMTAMLGLAACDMPAGSSGQSQMYPLLDSTGRVVAYAPPSAVRNAPPGTAVRLNINGQDQLVTLGPRTSEGASAGVPVVVGSEDGRPVVTRVGPGAGDLGPTGTPYVTGTGADGRPIITYVQPGQQAPTGTVGGSRQRAPGQLAPRVAPVVEPAR
ncbi:hypothetical protein [Roseococcus pinisoli]|uniref:Lipoprotein n=1 Tax=Roseococcus pinisoli TaxID=2835040 RepID=A0ABS5QDR1_9PROT|nr:hypothetical protein [Roseococcus pinisoli]MBS7811845.1 hypothetical protein [Roseococcus pinisoli]